MAEQEMNYVPYAYTYDHFTVFFYGDRVFLSGKEYPVGQGVVDMMNVEEAVLDGIDQRVRAFIPAAQALLTEKTDSAAALAQERLNAVWELVFALPVYRDLKMDEAVCYHLFERLMADPEKWGQVLEPTSQGYEMYQQMLKGFAYFSDSLREFRLRIARMIAQYFEPLERRNAFAYAEAYADFYARAMYVGAAVGDDLSPTIPLEVSFVPMLHPTEKGKVFVAEKATFTNLPDFLEVEFYRGLAQGNAPRKCHNCGKYFLLTQGYNTCYCNNIAPGETERTCRKVGAHRKEAQGRANRTPARKEYDRAYLRLKQRKLRKKISVDEWNIAVAKAQELLEQSERGALTDEELRKKLNEL